MAESKIINILKNLPTIVQMYVSFDGVILTGETFLLEMIALSWDRRL